jgi:hypothetical protein
MFEFSFLPFSTSNTAYFNGEIYNIILNIDSEPVLNFGVSRVLNITLNIDQDSNIILI